MENVALRFEYTQAEYEKAERKYLFASKTITKTSIVVLAIFLPASFTYLFYSNFSNLGIISAIMGVVATVGTGVLYFYLPTYKFKQTEKYHEEYYLFFSALGIKFETPSIQSELSWDVYSELWESADFYYLIQAPRMYTLIPKRAFKNADARQAFEELALSNLPNKKRVV